jgi:hypothetical protein
VCCHVVCVCKAAAEGNVTELAAAYVTWVDGVKAAVPADQLLIFNVKQVSEISPGNDISANLCGCCCSELLCHVH